MCRGRVIGDGDPGSEGSEATLCLKREKTAGKGHTIFSKHLEKMKRVRMIVIITQNLYESWQVSVVEKNAPLCL